MFQKIKQWWRKRKIRNYIQGERNFHPYRAFGHEMVLMNHVESGNTPEEQDGRLDIENVASLIHLLEADVQFSTEGLDRKIKTLEERAEFFEKTLHQIVPPNIDHALKILKARKKYPKLVSKIPWKTTTKEKIDALCKQYKVMFGEVANFLPELPEEAVKELEAFSKVWKKAVEDFEEQVAISIWVIAPASLFRDRKGDPIMLAKSPFGDFYYVICAWDKEVEFVKDLLA